MKMKKEHQEELRLLIEEVLARAGEENVKNYILDLHLDKNIKDIKVRFVWDVFRGISPAKRCAFIVKAYEYLHDNHVNTALMAIIGDKFDDVLYRKG